MHDIWYGIADGMHVYVYAHAPLFREACVVCKQSPREQNSLGMLLVAVCEALIILILWNPLPLFHTLAPGSLRSHATFLAGTVHWESLVKDSPAELIQSIPFGNSLSCKLRQTLAAGIRRICLKRERLFEWRMAVCRLPFARLPFFGDLYSSIADCGWYVCIHLISTHILYTGPKLTSIWNSSKMSHTLEYSSLTWTLQRGPNSQSVRKDKPLSNPHCQLGMQSRHAGL